MFVCTLDNMSLWVFSPQLLCRRSLRKCLSQVSCGLRLEKSINSSPVVSDFVSPVRVWGWTQWTIRDWAESPLCEREDNYPAKQWLSFTGLLPVPLTRRSESYKSTELDHPDTKLPATNFNVVNVGLREHSSSGVSWSRISTGNRQKSVVAALVAVTSPGCKYQCRACKIHVITFSPGKVVSGGV